jgi:hypothetical protein
MAQINGIGKATQTMRTQPQKLVLVPFLWGLGAGACTSNPTPVVNGACQPDPAVTCGVGDASAETVHLTGYACTGSARPDDSPVYVEGVPQGTVCADEGTTADGKTAYCCTSFTTRCAYNPMADCPDPGTYGYQCRGGNRPEVVNPATSCNQGVREDELINYCCSGTQRAPNCTQSDSVGCLAGLTGWSCPKGVQPTAQDLGANKSRADLFYLLCPVPQPAPNPKMEVYCCFNSSLAPVGGTCQQDLKVPNCAPGRFGIACFGTDRPEETFARLTCPLPGVPGLSEQGYPATVYCCDFTR